MNYEEISGKLEGEYHKVFDEVEAYAILKNYVGEEKEEMMMNLLDMLLTAQTEGKDAEKIVGTDIIKFCENYFSAYDKGKGKLEQILFMLSMYSWLGLFNCILDMFDDDMKFVGLTAGAKTDWTVMICCIGVAALVSTGLDIVLNIIYHNKPAQSGKLTAIVVISAVISAGLGLVISYKCNIELMLPLMPTMLICITVIVVCFVIKRVKNYKKFGSIWEPKDENKGTKPLDISDDNDVLSEYERMMINEFERRYNAKNEKCRKKNEPALTPEEFMDFLEKENVKLKKDSRRMPVMWSIICVVCTGVLGIAGVYSGFIEGIYFFITLASFMFIIYYLIFVKLFYGKLLKDRVQLFEKCRRNNKTVLDYVREEK